MNLRNSETLLVGAGPMSIAYAKALAHSQRSFVVAGRGQASAEAFKAATGVMPGTGALDAQLATMSEIPSRAIVAVGVADLPDVTKMLLEAGVERVLLEKPGAPTVDTMQALAAADPEDRIRIAYNRRFLPSVQKALEVLKADGGAQTIHFEFTEMPGRVLAKTHPAEVLDNWALANSSHVMDMAFYLAGAAENLSDLTLSGQSKAGHLDWHSAGSRFVGCGEVGGSTLFSYNADWGSGGGWAVEVCTPERRLRFRPLETLSEQIREQFSQEAVPFNPDPDGIKPGLPGMLNAFYDLDGAGLPTAAQQADRMAVFSRLLRG